MFIACKEIVVEESGYFIKKDCIIDFHGFAEDEFKSYILSQNERFMIYGDGNIESTVFREITNALSQGKTFIEKNFTVVRMYREGHAYTSVYTALVEEKGASKLVPLEELIEKADELEFNRDGCVSCDSCCFRSETSLCMLSDNDNDCMLIGFRSKQAEGDKHSIRRMSLF